MSPDHTPSGLTDLILLPEEALRSRHCFVLRIRPERLAEYVEVHQSVWPEMLAALHESGWRNYSLFLRAEDGLVVGYFEADDVRQAEALMDRHPVNARWQAEMAQYFVEGSTPEALTQYFRLD
jgi:L-rhamnose mutarotase